MYPPLYGGGQGFESPRLHSKYVDLQVKHELRMGALDNCWAFVKQPCKTINAILHRFKIMKRAIVRHFPLERGGRTGDGNLALFSCVWCRA
jgi:hypothetical protein